MLMARHGNSHGEGEGEDEGEGKDEGEDLRRTVSNSEFKSSLLS